MSPTDEDAREDAKKEGKSKEDTKIEGTSKPKSEALENQNKSHNSNSMQLTRKQWLFGLTLLFLLIAVIWLIYWIFWGRFSEYTNDAYVAGNQVKVMPEITGQVIAIRADETDLVEKGSPLVLLEKSDAEIALRNAKDDLAVTTRNVGQFYTNVLQARANVNVQQKNFVKAKEDYERRQKLVVNTTITPEDLRHALLAKETAENTLKSAEHALASATVLVQNTDLYNHPQVKQSADRLRNAYLNWRRTTIYAPDTGYVAKRNVQVGQQVNPNTILMIIVPLDQIWVNANFKESQLANIRIGQPATLYADAYGDIKFRGTVLGLNPGTGSAFDLLPPQNATGNWIKIVQRLPVRIAVDPKDLKKHPLRIGLSMEVTVDTSDRGGHLLSQVPQNTVIYSSRDYSADIKEADKIIEEIITSNAKNMSLKDMDKDMDKNVDKEAGQEEDRKADDEVSKSSTKTTEDEEPKKNAKTTENKDEVQMSNK